MSQLRSFAHGVIEFVVGDDWIVAVGVVVTLLCTWALGKIVTSWWVVLVGVAATVGLALRRAIRGQRD